MNTKIDSLENLIDDIHKKINRDKYIFLIRGAENLFTSSLFDIKENTVEYSNDTVEIFEMFTQRIQSLFRGKGILVLSQFEINKPATKLIPFYNPEIFNEDLFELIVYQEFDMLPKWPKRQEVLKQSLVKEKIKQTLVYACLENNTPRILECLKKIKKSELDQSFKYGGTPLGYCAKYNNVTCFKLIAEAGANVGKITLQYSTHTPLWIAFKHSGEIVKYIYESHPDVFNKEVNKYGFKIALECRDIELLKLVYEAGADLISKDPYFPNLHCFAATNNVTGLSFLLEKGFDINLKDKNKQTAFVKAKMRNNHEAADFLRTKGALE